MSFRHCFIAAALLTVAAGAVQAQAADAEATRATTIKLINALVEQGVLTSERAAALLKELQAPPAAAAPGAAAGAPAPVRVPYVPEFVRKELKEELRNEMVAQAFRDGWAGPGAVPEWARRISLDGDLRTRLEHDAYGADNWTGAINVNETNRTTPATPVLLNTTENRDRLRVRARFGLSAKVDEQWTSGIRLTTGSLTDPVSSNQTLGTYGTRFTAAFDRAYIRWRYGSDFSAVMGRFGNPWYGTDLVWANDLGFDGVALQWARHEGGLRPFVTLAALPVQEVELSAHDKWLFGAQIGADATPSETVRTKLGLGYYRYVNITGRANDAGSTLNNYTAPAFVQKGNSVFNISSDPNKLLLGLAAEYHIVNLTGTLDIESLAGKHLVLTADAARNLGYQRKDVAARQPLGRAAGDDAAEVNAFLVRAAWGDPDVHERGQWQAFFGIKRVQRDAVLDAFTDGDFHLGGTNAKGYFVGGSVGLGKNTAATLRWLSADTISGPPMAIDVLQFDLALRF